LAEKQPDLHDTSAAFHSLATLQAKNLFNRGIIGLSFSTLILGALFYAMFVFFWER
jgi:hypothetical protein